MYVIVDIMPYNYHNLVIKFITTYNSNISFNYLVLDAILPKVPIEYTEFMSVMRTIIQEKKCVSLSYGPDKRKRCLQWVLEMIDISQKTVSKLLYRFCNSKKKYV